MFLGLYEVSVRLCDLLGVVMSCVMDAVEAVGSWHLLLCKKESRERG